MLIEIREGAFRKGVSCAHVNNNQFTRSPADLTNLLLIVRKMKMRRKVSVNYKEHTWGDLTDRGRADVTSCHAPLRPHRFALLYYTPLNSSTPLCTTLPHSTVQLHFAPLCSTPFYSALHHRSIALAGDAGKSLDGKDPQLLLHPTHGWRTFGRANSCTMEIWRRNMCHQE